MVAAKYVITEVADIEEDGNTTAIDTLSILGNLEVTITPDQVSTNPPPSMSPIITITYPFPSQHYFFAPPPPPIILLHCKTLSQ